MHACLYARMYVERDYILLGTGAGPSSPRSRPHVREQLNTFERKHFAQSSNHRTRQCIAMNRNCVVAIVRVMITT